MSKLLQDLQMQEANALQIAQFCRDQINKINKPKKEADPKITAAIARAHRNSQKRYS